MTEQVFEILRDDWVIMALPFFFGALLIEVIWAYRSHTKHFESVDFWTSIRVMLLTVFVDLIPKFLGISLMFVAYSVSPLKGVIDNGWFWWVLLFFLDDLTYYCFHRGNHEIRLLWAGHVSHHSSQYYNLGTALRQGVGERILKYPFWVPLALLGYHPAMIVTMLSLSLIYQYWLHTEAFYKFPQWIEFIFNTPSHHRVHHGSNVRYLDRNHGATLIIWDRLFGTFSEEIPDEPVKYGLTKNIETHRVLKVAFGEYGSMWRDVRRAQRWSHKLNYIFKAPGWSHDGPDLRSDTLRRA